MANIDDIGKPGGWLVEVVIPGGIGPQYWYVYELDKDKALDLAKREIPVNPGETVKAMRLMNIHEFTGFGMKPGDVKQHV